MKKQRPTIALAMIVKNEAHNLQPLLQSVKGCFDEIHITDTGSTDGTLEFIEKINQKIENGEENWTEFPRIQLHHFEWIDDFAAARDASFSHPTTDYVFWMDGDDQLTGREEFIRFRDNVMHTAHMWLATYDYEHDKETGRPICSFLRERVIKNDFGFKWKYVVHEGIIGGPELADRPIHRQITNTWKISHRRTAQDKAQDTSRNLKILQRFKPEDLCPRMYYYLGKEYLDNGEYLKASKYLKESLGMKLELHDRIMATQCAIQCAIHCDADIEGYQLAMKGIELRPTRAEFWVLAGDANLKLARKHGGYYFDAAVQYYRAARLLENPDNINGLTYTSLDSYFRYPTQQLAQIFAHLGHYEAALQEINNLRDKCGTDVQIDRLEEELKKRHEMGKVSKNLPKNKDVIISCTPQAVTKNWDERVLEEKGLGGSETACIEVAKFIHKYTGRPVKIFHYRDQAEIMPSGVEYIPSQQIEKYLHNREPACHIAWRHAARLTWAPSYVWSHDLVTQGGENVDNYDKYMVLSGFHKEYVRSLQGVPDEKFLEIRNGIDPRLWTPFVKAKSQESPMGFEKNPNKIIFSSSPDRGLDRCIHIVKKAREMSGKPLELHLFYGYDNMRKMGGHYTEMANKFEKLVEENADFVHYHGNVDKKTLTRHFTESVIWLYPANFIETFCITAIEAVCSGTYPLVRNMGALPYTLAEENAKEMATILNCDAETPFEHEYWADQLIKHIDLKAWERVNVDIEKYSWENVAKDFIQKMRL